MQKKTHEYISLLSKPIILILGVLFVLTGIFFFRMGRVTDSEIQEYKMLMENAESYHSSAKQTPYTAHQDRERIQKDLFFYKGNDRLQIRLIADEAQLVLDHQEADTQVIEHMHNVKCAMQEELYYKLPNGKEASRQSDGRLLLRQGNPQDPASWITLDLPGLMPMQIIRFIDANDATYEYKTDRFVADNVRISRYAIPGHQLREVGQQAAPLMSGTAKHVEFSLKNEGRDFNFKAHQLKAAFHDTSRMNL